MTTVESLNHESRSDIVNKVIADTFPADTYNINNREKTKSNRNHKSISSLSSSSSSLVEVMRHSNFHDHNS